MAFRKVSLVEREIEEVGDFVLSKLINQQKKCNGLPFYNNICPILFFKTFDEHMDLHISSR